MSTAGTVGTILGAILGSVIAYYGMAVVRRRATQRPLKTVLLGALLVCFVSLALSFVISASFIVVARSNEAISAGCIYAISSAVTAFAGAATLVALASVGFEAWQRIKR